MTNLSTVCILCAAEFPHEPTELCKESIEEIKTSVGNMKVGEEMKDPTSTGRKRAAEAAPIEVGMVCEWKRLKEAGGGPVPIKGCPGNPATDRHHGPDKSVLNNEVGVNLHRICSPCHNRWHSENDFYYGDTREDRPANGAEWLPWPIRVGELEVKAHNPDDKMTQIEALMFEATRNQEDKRKK
jgi:hypothetical protein